jgi:hypothetical protein
MLGKAALTDRGQETTLRLGIGTLHLHGSRKCSKYSRWSKSHLENPNWEWKRLS